MSLKSAYPLLTLVKQRYEEFLVYFPYASHFDWTPFWVSSPLMPSFNTVSPFPVLTYYVYGALFSLLGKSWGLFLILIRFGLPVLTFWMLVKICSRYISRYWSLLLAFWGVTYMSAFSYGTFGLSLLSGTISWDPIFLDITQAPFPSVSVAAFAGMLAWTLSYRTYSIKSTWWLSVGWAIQWGVSLTNGLVGSLFWLGMLVSSTVIHRQKSDTPAFQSNLMKLGIFGVTTLVGIAPLLISYLKNPVLVLSYTTAIAQPNDEPFTLRWVLLTYGLPILLTIGLRVIQSLKTDAYSKLARQFYPILLLVAVELIVLNAPLFLGPLLGPLFQPGLVIRHISVFITRPLIWIPFIYSLHQLADYIRQIPIATGILRPLILLPNQLIRYERIFIPGLIGLISIIILTGHVNQVTGVFHPGSNPRSSRHLQTQSQSHSQIHSHTQPNSQSLPNTPPRTPWASQFPDIKTQYAKSLDQAHILWHNHIRPHDRVVAQSLSDQLILTNLFGYSSLILPLPSHYLFPEIALSYLALHFQLANWPFQFAQSFLDPTLLKALPSYSITHPTQFQAPFEYSGFGYWLIYHNAPLTDDTRLFLDLSLMSAYQSIPLEDALTQTPIKAVILNKTKANTPPIPAIPNLKLLQQTLRYDVFGVRPR